ncbi:SGNH hydrolase [Tothia fuscella]|uniref:SGNH hydrolase n=1 Tax=Tothia fuscella TaxID=1048955 RepID=A0A9P4NU62_9PEZI|nr:SGNH hydrolase [Tothia fuscella]
MVSPQDMAPLMDQIMLFGDSITEFAEGPEGFASVLRYTYIRRLDVVNRGLSGYNTDMALRVLDKIIPLNMPDKIRILTLFFGANDSCFPTETNNQCVPLPQFRTNLIKIITTFQSRKNPRIILITNPPIDERSQRVLDNARGFDLRRTAENTKLYADAIRSVGKEFGFPVLDLWGEIMGRAGWKPGWQGPLPGSLDLPPNPVLAEYLTDGLHLSGMGYQLLSSCLMHTIGTSFPDQLPEDLPYVLPSWSDGDAWKMCGETDFVINHRLRVIAPPVTDNGIHKPLPSIPLTE